MPVLASNALPYWQPLLLPKEDLDEDLPEMKRLQLYINLYQQKQRYSMDKMDEGIS